jgi:hypothetical protein
LIPCASLGRKSGEFRGAGTQIAGLSRQSQPAVSPHHLGHLKIQVNFRSNSRNGCIARLARRDRRAGGAPRADGTPRRAAALAISAESKFPSDSRQCIEVAYFLLQKQRQ